MMFQHGYGMYMGAGDGLLVLLEWVIVIAAIIWLFRMAGGRHGRHPRHWMGGGAPWMNQGALEILRERFAKGEINKEEYEERKKVLSEDK